MSGEIPKEVKDALIASLPQNLEDLLTPDVRRELHKALTEMAQKRRRAEASSGHLVIS
jgi:hypothetical protein